MAIEVRHSRTATLVDSGANPGYDANEIQAADWNDTHPVTATSVGLLFAGVGGTVSETMTPDRGTITASSPFTFKQTWDNAAADVVFRGVVIEAVDFASGEQGDPASSYFDIKTGAAGSTTRKMSYGRGGLLVDGSLQLFNGDVDTSNVAVEVNPQFKRVRLGTIGVDNQYTNYLQGGATCFDVSGGQEINYGPSGISLNAGKFFLPVTQTEIATWAGAPSTSDIDAGYAQVGKDTSAGTIWLAVNDGGTIRKVQLT